MIRIVLQKLLSKRWMVLCVLAGTILAVAMVSSIPIYTRAILHRLLTRDLVRLHEATGVWPGRLSISFDGMAYDHSRWPNLYHDLFDRFTEDLFAPLALPVMEHSRSLSYDLFDLVSEDTRRVTLEAHEDFLNHARILQGRALSAEVVGGVIEVMATQESVVRNDLRLGQEYMLTDRAENVDPIRVRLVGTFTSAAERDLYWSSGMIQFDTSLVADFGVYKATLMDTPHSLQSLVRWSFATDYREITTLNLERILEAHADLTRWAKRYGGANIRMPAIGILLSYGVRKAQLTTTLWVLQVPVILILAFYLYMVSRLLVASEKNEIAVLKSRGAQSRQIFLEYLIEGGLMSIAALAAGPPLGLLLCRILGAANGFLEFVHRTGLRVVLDHKAYIYGLIAVAVSLVAMLIPALVSSRTTIVLHKQARARREGRGGVGVLLAGLALVAMALYGLGRYRSRQADLAQTGVSGLELSLDPLLFLISTLFLLGAGLILLKAFPRFVRAVHSLGRGLWPPPAHAALVQVGRAGGENQFVVLFLILAVATGIYGASAARTLNTNVEDQVRYHHGADITLRSKWEGTAAEDWSTINDSSDGMEAPAKEDLIFYQEPPFVPYTTLAGVAEASRVFSRNDVTVQLADGASLRQASYMAVVPHEFGQVAHFPEGLLSIHPNAYLNLLAKHPKAALVSRSLAEEHGVKGGDTIYVNWARQDFLPLVVYGFVDYWPTFNPFAGQIPRNTNGWTTDDLPDGLGPHLVVGNLDHTHAKMALEPYDVWLRLGGSTSSSAIYEEIRSAGLLIERLDDAGQQLIRRKNDPLLQGTNGSLTLGFMVTMAVSVVGLLIFWILSIKERLLQFGVFRAMGIGLGQIILMLVLEQALITGFALPAGAAVGALTSRLFVPLLQVVYSAAEQVPPFRVVTRSVDYLRVYATVGGLLIATSVTIAIILSRLRIHQAIKLGEE